MFHKITKNWLLEFVNLFLFIIILMKEKSHIETDDEDGYGGEDVYIELLVLSCGLCDVCN